MHTLGYRINKLRDECTVISKNAFSSLVRHLAAAECGGFYKDLLILEFD